MNLIKLSQKLPLGPDVRVLQCNDHGLVALDKPAGVMSHPNGGKGRKCSLLTASYNHKDECFSWKMDGESRHAWLVNRLDSPTSGVVLLALNQSLARVVKHEFATRKVTKIYYALCKSQPSSPAGNWNDLLSKSFYRNGCLIQRGERISAKTHYEVVKKIGAPFNLSLIKLIPLTGRTHQLRMQCSKHHHPVVGDRTYGNFNFNREVAESTGMKQMMLHSGEIMVHYTDKGRTHLFHANASLPEAFTRVMDFCSKKNSTSSFHSSAVPEKESSGKSRKRSVLEGRRFRSM